MWLQDPIRIIYTHVFTHMCYCVYTGPPGTYSAEDNFRMTRGAQWEVFSPRTGIVHRRETRELPVFHVLRFQSYELACICTVVVSKNFFRIL